MRREGVRREGGMIRGEKGGGEKKGLRRERDEKGDGLEGRG